jgi:Flp pilus assembly protein TadG
MTGPQGDGRRGQGIVEFALLLPVFMTMLFGLIDGGRLVYENSVVSQAAREAARRAAVEVRWVGSTAANCGAIGGPVCPASVTTGNPNLVADALAAANAETSPFGNVTSARFYMRCDKQGSAPTGGWTGVSCTNRASGDVVSVRLEMQYTPITPVVGQIFGTRWLSGAATMVIN